ncbi:P-loop containing nucleoside triphosphate hydrolase protein [Talaromyces proteolyticus]|uniref:P-loop containing nucleoside triphosphate hydrolase protein n=1 Tax=Talaromyces proteolyticus TaxID=1131652 RepID=A0AAD4KI98_9EURO|nr:P-loop containing nucleoside triphosphate hydrolase protein [Talaromyces proteolyticus]KAH8689078.1 P-loop containing nucleoside triphosphate hydrolase protein [Talaromyces proteolyticus]
MSDRSARLSKYLFSIEKGNKKIQKASDAKLFLEALCDQDKNPVRCIERILSSELNTTALNTSFRVDLSVDFLRGAASDFLRYLQHPGIENLCNGQFLRRILSGIVDPPTYWNALVEAHRKHDLSELSEQGFAWLLLNLLNMPVQKDSVHQIAQETVQRRDFLDSPSTAIRGIGYKIDNILKTTSTALAGSQVGGRHDNDFQNFREISILPTADEIACPDTPFYRRADEIYQINLDNRPAAHHDNHFRLLREDLLAELREGLQAALGHKKGRRPAYRVDGLTWKGVETGPAGSRRRCCVTFSCNKGLPQLSHLSKGDRHKVLDRNRNLIKNQGFGCLLYEKDVIAFGTIDRTASSLLDDVPTLAIEITGRNALRRILQCSVGEEELIFIVVNTPVFAYEPILQRLQEKLEFPLSDTLLSSEPSSQDADLNEDVSRIIKQIKDANGLNIRNILGTKVKISLDQSQLEALIAGLGQCASIIQGPPGTGKSFIGALIAKVIHDHTDDTILVLCYTNHALDQFLECLMDIGIPRESMVRLGSKSTSRTKMLGLFEQSTQNSQISGLYVSERRQKLDEMSTILQETSKSFLNKHVIKRDILEYIEFSNDSDFYDAFTLPDNESDFTPVGSDGKAIDKYYLLDQWLNGHDAGIFNKHVLPEHVGIWAMSFSDRKRRFEKWTQELFEDWIASFITLFEDYARVEKELDDYFYDKKYAETLRQKRIIACTTTAAAKYTRALQAAKSGVIIVEEAGEILESHVLTAMTGDTKQLVLIGDHKQLRPKINNYALSVEKGDGYDLNRSLFERLVLRGFPHTALSKQHRMRPEISRLIRDLTYPDLSDASKTLNRPHLRGFQNDVIFVNHDEFETDLLNYTEKRDPSVNSSKQNPFEVQMALMAVRYLGQQGYNTEEIIILTPYLGQLSLLRTELSKTNDPILNDLDSSDLIEAGLMNSGTAKLTRQPIRISTIDNYQGEERDIVVVTLTRSNKVGDIGFLAAPERVNVLLSRARTALVIIGNSDTFLNSKKGISTWKPLFELLVRYGHVYDGFPVKCERHPDRTLTIRQPGEFLDECPDGGCLEPCTAKLSCKVHTCPQRCHRLDDHSKVKCLEINESRCPKKHTYRWVCYKRTPGVCPVCLKEEQEEVERKMRDHTLEQKRLAIQKEHAKNLEAIEQSIKAQQELLKDIHDEKARRAALAQRTEDLENLKNALSLARQEVDSLDVSTIADKKSVLPDIVPTPQIKKRTNRDSRTNNKVMSESSGSPDTSISQTQARSDFSNSQRDVSPATYSPAKDEWERQKELEGQSSRAIDELMNMIGLEEVKDKFLSIKTKVDTVVRQGSSLNDERFNSALLGNPGTGKTTVARLYAKFLKSVGVIPGSHFVETSGAKLANEGVSGCRKILEEILSNDGGALFIDEAYQLTAAHNSGGRSVLDFLLPEIENLTGKVVFIIAGYKKNMETFFGHNPGIPSRFPIQLNFEDYSDQQLQLILNYKMTEKYRGKMKVEGGHHGLYVRIVARRIGHSRGREGFGNARAVHNEFGRISDRQARRLAQERRAGKKRNDLFLTKEDLLGPEPKSALEGNAAWKKLQTLVGLDSVKQSVQALLDTLQTNYQRELREKPPITYSLNNMFIGNPGTGKTTVAKLYGQILADLGFLSNGEVVVKNPSDFISQHIGGSEKATKDILAATVGKVLVIDEAYMLAGSVSSDNSHGSRTDMFRAAVIDTLVAEVQSVPGDDRCVLLLGYKEPMEKMFQNTNPGLARRFPMASAFKFEDYTDDELQIILDLKLHQSGFDATKKAREVVRECLTRARNRPNFGNAGEIDILMDQAKLNHQKRLKSRETRIIDILEPVDFDPDFDRADRASSTCRKLFEGVIGCEELIDQLENYQRRVRNMKKLNKDPREQIPFNFLFRGPAGTGKTSTARRMGQVYYDMGFLAAPEVVEASTSDLVGQYIGHTGPKTEKLLEKALGKVLFIDEAYRLNDSRFGKEAMDQLVDSITKHKYYQKLIIILAGYDTEIDQLMSSNPGLSSRFPEIVNFKSLNPDQCWELFQNRLKENEYIDSDIIQNARPTFRELVIEFFDALSALPGWGNARDVETVVKSIIGKILATIDDNTTYVVTHQIVFDVLRSTFNERRKRAAASPGTYGSAMAPPSIYPTIDPSVPSPAAMSPPLGMSDPSGKVQSRSPSPCSLSRSPTPVSISSDSNDGRDAGISDETWGQLQLDKKAAEKREETLRQVVQQADDAKSKVEKLNPDDNDEELRKYEEMISNLVKEQMALEEMKRQEEAAKKKLRELGLCPQGYQWIKQDSGYRCGGGSHYMSNEALNSDAI